MLLGHNMSELDGLIKDLNIIDKEFLQEVICDYTIVPESYIEDLEIKKESVKKKIDEINSDRKNISYRIKDLEHCLKKIGNLKIYEKKDKALSLVLKLFILYELRSLREKLHDIRPDELLLEKSKLCSQIDIMKTKRSIMTVLLEA